MQRFFLKQNDYQDILKEAKVKEYIDKYLKEIQRHFDLSDKKMSLILSKVYKEFSLFNIIKKRMKKWFDVLKSFCQNKLRK